MNGEHKKLKDWVFEIDEISANVYRIRGVDKKGRSIERTGSDLETLLKKCEADAKNLDRMG
ncbi:MAG: hypothetical protein R6U50_00925 [Desulfobacterales bacterium]